MTDTVTIRRELLERIIEDHAPGYHDCINLLGYECEWCELRAAIAEPVQGEAVAWARQCDLDESDPAIFVAREEVQESGYLVPLYTTPPQPADVGELVEALEFMVDRFGKRTDAHIFSKRLALKKTRAALAKLEGEE